VVVVVVVVVVSVDNRVFYSLLAGMASVLEVEDEPEEL